MTRITIEIDWDDKDKGINSRVISKEPKKGTNARELEMRMFLFETIEGLIAMFARDRVFLTSGTCGTAEEATQKLNIQKDIFKSSR